MGNAFVQQYYLVLHQSPDLVYRFYQDASRLARPASAAGAAGMDSVTTMEVSHRPRAPRSGALVSFLIAMLRGFGGLVRLRRRSARR